MRLMPRKRQISILLKQTRMIIVLMMHKLKPDVHILNFIKRLVTISIARKPLNA